MIAPNDWNPADGLTLEPNALLAAKEAVDCLALTAGPGAGKTEMLAQRADFLLRTGTCRYPKRILAISFKVDASTNLKERVTRRCGTELAARFDSHTFHAFAKRIIDRFRLVLKGDDSLEVNYSIGSPRIAHKQIEFDDLVPFAINILNTSPLALNAIRQTYTDVFLDEFQDCTTPQYELIKFIFQDSSIRLTAVGDTKQKIMAWAGAMEGIFTTYVNDFEAKPLNLYRNFRSKPQLLRMQNEIIRVMDSQSVMPDDQIEGGEGEIYAWSFPTSQDEARELADFIQDTVKQQSISLSEIAILFSKQVDQYAEHLMAELDVRKIPYRNEAKIQDISVEPLARLIIDYLTCLYGDREPRAWTRLMNLVSGFTFDEETNLRQEFQRFITNERESVSMLESIGESYKDWWGFVQTFLHQLGLGVLTSLSSDYESFSRLKQVIKDTRKYIEELLGTDPDLRMVLKRFSDDQAVRILTIHKSKGLEFHTVVVVGVEKETFWGSADNERCAYFVAISRAKERLILTVCQRREKPSKPVNNWKVERSSHEEFINYAIPFMSD